MNNNNIKHQQHNSQKYQAKGYNIEEEDEGENERQFQEEGEEGDDNYYNQDFEDDGQEEGGGEEEQYQPIIHHNQERQNDKILLVNGNSGQHQVNIQIQNHYKQQQQKQQYYQNAPYLSQIQELTPINRGETNGVTIFNNQQQQQYQPYPQQQYPQMAARNTKVTSILNNRVNAGGVNLKAYRPQSAKPIQQKLQGYSDSIGTSLNFYAVKNQTLKNDHINGATGYGSQSNGGQSEINNVRRSQIKQKLSGKVGGPYIQTIKAAQRSEYGGAIKQNQKQVQKELSNREKMLNEIMQTGNLTTKTNSDTVLSFKLKQQLRELQQVMKLKDAEIELLKRNIRSTRLEEAEKTIQIFIQEGARLRQLLEGKHLTSQNLSNLSHTSSNNNNNQNQESNIQKDGIIAQLKHQLQTLVREKDQHFQALQAKDKEIQIWRQRMEKTKPSQQTNNVSSKIQGESKSSPIKKEELQFMKQKIVDLQNAYDQVLLENQQLLEQVDKLQSDSQQQLQDHQQQISTISTANTNNQKKLQKSFDQSSKQKDTIIKDLEKQVQKILQEKVQLQTLVKEMQEKHKDEIEQAKLYVEDQIKEDYENNEEESVEKHKAEIKKIQLENEKAINKVQNEMKTKHQAELKDLMNELQTKHQKESQQAQVKIEDSLNLQHKQQLSKFEQQLKEKDIQIHNLTLELQSINSSLQVLKGQYEENLRQRVQNQIPQSSQPIQSKSQLSQLNNLSLSSQHSELKQPKQALEQLPVISEQEIKPYFEKLRRAFQLEGMEKEEIQKRLFDQTREDISIKDFSSILYKNFMLDQSDALKIARFIIENPKAGDKIIDYDQNLKLLNRKIFKIIQEKVLGANYEAYTASQLQRVIQKFRDLAKGHYEDLEQNLVLYDEEEKGIISIEDLKEGLASIEIYEGKDKSSFQSFTLHLLGLNNKDTEWIKISDILETLYPEQNQVKKRKSTNSIINKSLVSESIKNSKQKIQEEIKENVSKVSEDQLIKSIQSIQSNQEEEQQKHIENSEKAFQIITQYLQTQNMSLRNTLKDKIYDVKIAIINENEVDEDTVEGQYTNSRKELKANQIDQTFEVINTEDFFLKLKQVQELSSPLKTSIVQVAGKQLSTTNKNKNQFFIYKDLEEILGAYGFIDSSKPLSSKNLKFDLLDQKSIRIMNRFVNFLQESNQNLCDLFKNQFYQKTINNSHLGSERKQFKFQFLRTKVFFDQLHDLGLIKTSKIHQNLINFLTIDSNVYKKGLVVKKLEKLIKECQSNEYLQSVGMKKKVLSHDYEDQEVGQMVPQIVDEEEVIEDENADINHGEIIEDEYREEMFDQEDDGNMIEQQVEEVVIDGYEIDSQGQMQIPSTSKGYRYGSNIGEEEDMKLNTEQQYKTDYAEIIDSNYDEDVSARIVNQYSESAIEDNYSEERQATAASTTTKRAQQSSAQPNQKSNRNGGYSNNNNQSHQQNQNINNAGISQIGLIGQINNNNNSSNPNEHNYSHNGSNRNQIQQQRVQNNNDDVKVDQFQNIEIYQLESYLKIKGSSQSLPLHEVKKNPSILSTIQPNKDLLTVNQNNVSMINDDNGFLQNFEYDGVFQDNTNINNQIYTSAINPFLAQTLSQDKSQIKENYAKEMIVIINSDGQNHTGLTSLMLGSKTEKNKQRTLSQNIYRKPNLNRSGGLIELCLNNLLTQFQNSEILIKVIQFNSDNKVIDKLTTNNQDAFILGTQIFTQTSFQIENKESIKILIKYLDQQKILKNQSLIQISISSKIDLKFLNLNSLEISHSLDNFQNFSQSNIISLLKKAFHGHSKLISLSCVSKNNKNKDNLRKTLQLSVKLNDLKQKQKDLAQAYVKVNSDQILNSLPHSLLNKHTILKTLKLKQPDSSPTIRPLNQHKQQTALNNMNNSLMKNSFQAVSLVESSNSSNYGGSFNIKKMNNQNQYQHGNKQRMTTISEQPREDGGQSQDTSTLLNLQTSGYDQSPLLIKPHTDYQDQLFSERASHLNTHSLIESGRMSVQMEIEQQMLKSLEQQILQKSQEEYWLMEEHNQMKVQVERLKGDLHKQQKRSTQKNQRQQLDNIKSQVKSSEQKSNQLQEKLNNIRESKAYLSNQIQNLSDRLNKPLQENEKDKKLREMELIIKEMSKKLQEKEQIIAETTKSQNTIQDTFKTLKKKELLSSNNNLNQHQIQKPQPIQTQINNQSKHESAFSPTLNRKSKDFKKPSALLQRQKSGCGFSSSSQSSLQTLSESSSMSILPMQPSLNLEEQKKEKQPYQMLLDKKKNHSTANLFKWTKPTVSIKINTENNEASQTNSGSNSIKNNQILNQQTTKVSQQNKMSMILTQGNTNTNNTQLKSHTSYDNSTEQSQDGNFINIKKSMPIQNSKKNDNIVSSKNDKLFKHNSGKENSFKFKEIHQDLIVQDTEGVQCVKKSIVPIRQINNLLLSSTNNNSNLNYSNQSFDNSVNKYEKSLIHNYQVNLTEKSINSPLSPSGYGYGKSGTKLKQKMLPQEKNLKQEEEQFNTSTISNGGLGTGECGNDENIQNTPTKIKQKIYQLANSKNKFAQQQSTKVTIDITGGKKTQQTNNIAIIRSQEVVLLSSTAEQDLHQRNHSSINNQPNINQDNSSLIQRKERLDNFLRKSFELMTTLRSSADQVSQLKPINRGAARLQSNERSGLQSTKNNNTLTINQGSFASNQVPNYTNTNNIQNDLLQPTRMLLYSRSPQHQIQYPQKLQLHNNMQDESTLENLHSKTLDYRVSIATMQQNFQSLTLDKNQGLTSNNNGNGQQSLNLKEQILQKCMVSNKVNKDQSNLRSEQQQHQSLTATQLRWMNRTLLNKCRSNESLISSSSAAQPLLLPHPLHSHQTFNNPSSNQPTSLQEPAPSLLFHHHDRPRSITIDKTSQQQYYKSPQQQQQQQQQQVVVGQGNGNGGSNNSQVKNINNMNIPKWGELANIIKANFSPKNCGDESQDPNKNVKVQPFMDNERSNNSLIIGGQQKQYMVKHNKIDLTQSMSNLIGISQQQQSSSQLTSSITRPPTNPQYLMKKKRTDTDEHHYQQQPNTTATLNQLQLNNSNSNTSTSLLNSARVRSESHYLPGCFTRDPRTPRDNNLALLSSPLQLQQNNKINNNNNTSNDSSYQNQRRQLHQQQSMQNISSLLMNYQSLQQQQQQQQHDQTYGQKGFTGGLRSTGLNINTNNNTNNMNNSFGLGFDQKNPITSVASSSADFSRGFFTSSVTTNLVSPSQQYPLSLNPITTTATNATNVEPIGRKDKARPEVTELIERQRSRINSQSRRQHPNAPAQDGNNSNANIHIGSNNYTSNQQLLQK